MAMKRKKKVSPLKKNNNTMHRLSQCAQRTAAHHANDTQLSANQPKQQLSAKDVENIILDLALAATYNHGDKKDVKFVQEVLQPNKINIPEGIAMESFWDKITNSGLVKPSIGFGNNDKITITPQGYELMEKFGSYQSFLSAQQQEAALKQQLLQQAANPNSSSVVVMNDANKEDQAAPIPIQPQKEPKPPKPTLPPSDPKEKPEDNNLNFE